jgi:hypothetical protein
MAMQREKPLPDEQEMRRRVAEQVANAKDMIQEARQIRKLAIEMRENKRRRAS